MNRRGSEKGRFGPAGLPVAEAYVRPASRRGWILAGFVAAAVLVVAYALATSFGLGELVSGGALSSSHAAFEDDCARCHTSFKGVSEAMCLACHDPIGDETGEHTFLRHVLYRPGERTQIDSASFASGPTCMDCHREHDGRAAAVTRIEDRSCSPCHFSDFSGDHPEFDFAANAVPDDSTLIFTHIRHTQFVLNRLQTTDLERACSTCHVAEPDGRGFTPIDFGAHCARCHLTGKEGAPVPAGSPADDPPGVLTLADFKDLKEPGTLWAFSTNPSDFTPNRAGTRVKKNRPLHRDPWVLSNLRLIRRELTGDRGLADLIPTSGLATGETTFDLYREILGRLAVDADALRGRPEPEIKAELASLDSLSGSIRRMLASGSLPPPAPWLKKTAADTGLDPARRGSLLDLVDKLTRECRVCHVMDGASVARVQKRQRALLRAEFDHAAHVIDRACVDCHAEIPVTKAMTMTEPAPLTPDRDRSGIQNLPTKASCVGCHASDRTDDRCSTCHLYHPEPVSPNRIPAGAN